MEATGKIIAILQANSGVSQKSGNPWMSQTFVLETIEQYPKKIPFEVFGEDRIRNFNIQMGETVTINFDVDGREWNGRWFPKISCYNLTRAGQASTAQPQQATQQSSVPQQSQTSGSADDLPF